VEHPGELGVRRHLALVEHDRGLGVDTAGEERRGHLADVPAQLLWVLPHRDRMQIDHAVDARVAVLQPHEVADGAQIVAQMQVPGGLHAGEDFHEDVPVGLRTSRFRSPSSAAPQASAASANARPPAMTRMASATMRPPGAISATPYSTAVIAALATMIRGNRRFKRASGA